MNHQANAILLSAPPVSRKKTVPKPSNKFLCNASEDERAACVRLIRVMRTNTTYTEGYWLSFFLQGLLKLDASIAEDEVSIESAEKFIQDMKNFQNWNNWLRGASNQEHFRDHPAFAWIRKKEVDENESKRDLDVWRLSDMFIAPDDRKATDATEGAARRKRA